MMTISDLPTDLLVEIFSRVPLKSIRKVQLTCKKWNNISKSQSFLRMYLAKQASRKGEYQKVMVYKSNLSLMSLTVSEDPSTESKAELSHLYNKPKISQVMHCEGLLLCISKYDKDIVVWNPYMGQTRRIEVRNTLWNKYGFNKCWYALGYTNDKKESHRSNKLLRFIGYIGYYKKRQEALELYDFDSDQWKSVDLLEDWCVSLDENSCVSLKGNTYFYATKAVFFEEGEVGLMCFDYTRESFGPFMRMPFNSYEACNHSTLSCVGEEKLAVLASHHDVNANKVGVWITTSVEPEEVSWSKFLSFNMDPDIALEGFFIDKGKKVAMIIAKERGCSHYKLKLFGESGCLGKVFLGGRGAIYGMCSYVPSLVQIIKQQPLRGKRKRQQSKSEQLRY